MPQYSPLTKKQTINPWTLAYGIALGLSLVIGATLFLANNTNIRKRLPPKTGNIPELRASIEHCEIGAFWISVSGWAHRDLPDDSIKIYLFATGNKGAIQLLARRLTRKDVSDFLKIESDFHLHGFYASAVRYKLRKRYGASLELYVEDSKGVMHYGGENVCTQK
ncbi:hypothetical protein [Pseudomonas sp. RA_105y_Pfl2_P56]|uniref:hypothetical protein n=1 Tax=Pseudomonas sp. RA_105y_Pfl2_P56 TaxID=3088701 RepID=UPI0030D92E7B